MDAVIYGEKRVSDNLNYPSYRLGRICKIERKLTFFEALDLAESLKKAWPNLKDKIAAECTRVSMGAKPTFDSGSKGRPKLMDREYPILSYPAFSYRLQSGEYSYEIRQRNAVTVCLEEFSCKLWSRLSLLKFCKRCKGKNKFLPAVHLSKKEVLDYYLFAEEHAFHHTNMLMDVYNHSLHDFGINEQLSNAYNLVFRTMNSSDDRVRDFFRDYREGKIFVRDTVKQPECLSALENYFKIVFHRIDASQTEIADQVRQSYRRKYFTWQGFLKDRLFDDPELNALFAVQLSVQKGEIDRLVHTGLTYYEDDEYKTNNPSERANKEYADASAILA